MTPALRPMTAADEDSLMAIQHEAYVPDFYEEWSVFLNKLRLYPAGCWVCTVGEKVVAYLFSHPSEYLDPPALNRAMEKLPESPDCYYIHDAAIRPTHQGQGIGALLCAKAVEIATAGRFTQMALIAVQGSNGYWDKRGFSAVQIPEIDAKLRTYSANAVYMRRDLPNGEGK